MLRNEGDVMRTGRPTFFSAAEEAVLEKYLRLQAIIGSGPSPMDFREKCAVYISTLPRARRALLRSTLAGLQP